MSSLFLLFFVHSFIQDVGAESEAEPTKIGSKVLLKVDKFTNVSPIITDKPSPKVADDQSRSKRQTVDTVTDDDDDEDDKDNDRMNFKEKIYRLTRSQNFFNEPRVDRSSWQVPYPRMGKRSLGSMIPMARLGRSSMIPMARLGRSSMIPMARLGRSSMIPMARLGRSSQALVIPMARIGRSDRPSMIPMARIGRSVVEDGEQMVPLYLPNEMFNADWKLQHIVPHSERLGQLMQLLDEYLRNLDDQRLETEINEISTNRDDNALNVKKLE